MSEWESVKAENIVKHVPSGNYYLRAKVGGKIIRKTLGTGVLRTAKMKRDTMLRDLRASVGLWDNTKVVTLDDALALLKTHYRAIPSYQAKPASMAYRVEMMDVIKRTLAGNPSQWTPDTMAAWWGSPAITRYSSTRRNNLLGTVRRMIKLLVARGVMPKDPTGELERAKVVAKKIKVPSRKQFAEIVQSIRGQRKRASNEVANMVEFMAYCGCRVAECRAVVWGDIGKDTITFTGGEYGTKNWRERNVPIVGAMAELLATMERGDDTDPLFSLKSPHNALGAACERLGIDHMRVHDLRHLFATTCIENDVDIPTVSRWLGHQDGGALAMKTYGHLRDEHSKEQAKKVSFS